MKLIEFLGVSRAGKTSQIQTTQDRLVSRGFDTTIVQRPKIPFSDYPSLYDFHMSLVDFFLAQIGREGARDYVLLDRGFLDRQTLAGFDFSRMALSQQQYDQICAAVGDGLHQTDDFFLFFVPREISLGRIPVQASNGLDYSHLNGGLSVDEPDELDAMIPLYQRLREYERLTTISGTDDFEYNNGLILRRVLGNGHKRSRSYCKKK